MKPEAVSVVSWSVAKGKQSAPEMEGPDASTLSRLGAHLEFNASAASDTLLGHSLSLRSLETSFKHGMHNTFTTQPMAELIAAQQRSDTPGMTIALARLTDAGNSAKLLQGVANSFKDGIKALTQTG